MTRARDDRKRNKRVIEPTCRNCGNPGRHYCPASLGEPGFYACEAFAALTRKGS